MQARNTKQPEGHPTFEYSEKPDDVRSIFLKSLKWLIVLLTICCTGCTGPTLTSGGLPFSTIEQKSDPAYIGQQQYFALEPGILVFYNEESALAQGDLFSEDARLELKRVNYRTHFVLAVFQGWKPSAGFGVEINQLVAENGGVVVGASFRLPENGAVAGGAVTSPYHLIRVRRPAADLESLPFQLEVAGEVLAVFPNPTP